MGDRFIDAETSIVTKSIDHHRQCIFQNDFDVNDSVLQNDCF